MAKEKLFFFCSVLHATKNVFNSFSLRECCKIPMLVESSLSLCQTMYFSFTCTLLKTANISLWDLCIYVVGEIWSCVSLPLQARKEWEPTARVAPPISKNFKVFSDPTLNRGLLWLSKQTNPLINQFLHICDFLHHHDLLLQGAYSIVHKVIYSKYSKRLPGIQWIVAAVKY